MEGRQLDRRKGSSVASRGTQGVCFESWRDEFTPSGGNERTERGQRDGLQRARPGKSHPVVSAGGLCVQERLPGGLDGDRLVPAAAAISALGAVPVPPVPGGRGGGAELACPEAFHIILYS